MIGPRAAVLAIALFCSFMLPGVVRAASVEDGDPVLRITAQLRNFSIREALEAVALLAGRPIEVIGPIEEREISVNLHEATLLESIDKVLSPSNYVVILSEDKSLVIRVLGGAGDRADAGHDPQAESRDDPVDGLVSIFRDGPEVIPPSQPGEEGLTMADIEYYWSFARIWKSGADLAGYLDEFMNDSSLLRSAVAAAAPVCDGLGVERAVAVLAS